MGTIQHTAFIVTGCDHDFGKSKEKNLFTKSHKKARKLFGKDSVTKITGEGINGYKSFLVAPNGSKLGWESAREFDEASEKFIEYLDSIKYDDGSTCVEFVKVNFGEIGFSASFNNEVILSNKSYG